MNRFLGWAAMITGRWGYLLVLCAALLAEGQALRSTWYMDDEVHIMLNPDVNTSYSQPALLGRELTDIAWRTVYLCFGYHKVAFHGLNLLLHLLVAALTLATLREFVRRVRLPDWLAAQKEEAAFWGAMLFAVHPMCSEAVHYAAQTSMLLVSLFTVLAGYFLLRWRARHSLLNVAGLGAAILLATLSKEPGIFHALFVCLFLAVPRLADAAASPTWLSPTVRRRVGLGILFLGLLMLTLWLPRILSQFQNPEGLYRNVLTQSRLMFAYGWRMIVPLSQSSDHYVMWSMSARDWPATLALIFLGLGVAWLLVRSFRRRDALTPILCLAIFHLLIRFAYPVDEPMVEYRVYPSMPWVGFLLACGVARLVGLRPRFRHQHFTQAAWAGATIALAVLCLLRGAVWRSPESLHKNVLQQYPLNTRALSQHMAHLLKLPEGHLRVLAMKAEPENMGRETEAVRRQSTARHYSMEKMYRGFVGCQNSISEALVRAGQPVEALARTTKMLESVISYGDKLDKIFLANVLQTRAVVFDGLNERGKAENDRKTAVRIAREWDLEARSIKMAQKVP